VLVLPACMPGCSDRASQQPLKTDATVAPEPVGAKDEIQVSVKSREAVRELIKSHSGAVVVLDLWALW
jgi:hypothetical protein